MAPVIHTEALTKRYGRTPALTELDLDVPAGSLFGYLGRNGAGKTTTIRILAGLLRPTSGHACVLGAAGGLVRCLPSGYSNDTHTSASEPDGSYLSPPGPLTSVQMPIVWWYCRLRRRR